MQNKSETQVHTQIGNNSSLIWLKVFHYNENEVWELSNTLVPKRGFPLKSFIHGKNTNQSSSDKISKEFD